MWMNGSSARRSTPAKARRTGKPSPSYADGAVVTVRTGRSAVAAGSGSGTRGRTRVSLTVTAGMVSSFSEVSGGLARHKRAGAETYSRQR